MSCYLFILEHSDLKEAHVEIRSRNKSLHYLYLFDLSSTILCLLASMHFLLYLYINFSPFCLYVSFLPFRLKLPVLLLTIKRHSRLLYFSVWVSN
jgi:hypothetical protein